MLDKVDNYIIVKKKIHKVQETHGTWKVAFADFALAMMAFFLLMWIINHATQTEKQAISGYFQDPQEYVRSSGQVSVKIIVSEDATAKTIANNSNEKQRAMKEFNKMERLKQILEDTIEKTAFLQDYKEQIYLDITNEGLRIQIFDSDKRAMFPRSSARMNSYAFTLLTYLAEPINQVANRISIAGHTDAMPFQKSDNYTNWELSADRANAARNALLFGGLQEEKIAMVVGLASTILFDAEDPNNSSNRRISIIVLNQDIDLSQRQQEEKLNDIIKQKMQKKFKHNSNINN